MTATVVSDRLLALLVELDELWRESRVKWSFTEVLSASGIKLSHPSMTREWASHSNARRGAQIADIEDLADAGLIAVDWGVSSNGRRGELRLTPAGGAHVDRLASPSPAPSAPVGSDWQENIMPLLHAAADLESGLPPDGLVTQDTLNVAIGRPPGDPQTSTTLMQLSAAGYFRDELSVEQADGPIAFRLGEKALQGVAGWPGGSSDLASELLALREALLRCELSWPPLQSKQSEQGLPTSGAVACAHAAEVGAAFRRFPPRYAPRPGGESPGRGFWVLPFRPPRLLGSPPLRSLRGPRDERNPSASCGQSQGHFADLLRTGARPFHRRGLRGRDRERPP